jgi:DNA/RNA endonuclease YhcR with UshA esterase domain
LNKTRGIWIALALFAPMGAVTPSTAQTGKPGQAGKPKATSGGKSDRKPQSEVAAKTSFGTIAANSPAVKKALDAKDLAGAQKLVGKDGAFQGTVTKVYTSKGNSIIILDFSPKFSDALTAVLKPENYAKFPNMETLNGKHILVSGKFEDFHGKPQIVLVKPDQVKIIK